MENVTLYQKRRRSGESFLLAAVYGASGVSVLLLAGIVGYVFSKGFRVLSLRFLISAASTLRGTTGIAGAILNTFYIIVITLMTAVPVGVGAAVYLNEYAHRGVTARMVEFAMGTLAGIPSVIYGLFGMVFFGNVLGLGYSLMNGALTLALMVLPLIVSNTQEALRAVPEGYRHAAMGLGATKWYLTRTILLPAAMPGILTGILLAVGRIAGESAALLFTAGSARLLPKFGSGFWADAESLGNKVWESGGTLSVELYLQMQNGEYRTAFGIGCVLIGLLFLLNLLLKRLCH